MGLSGGRCFSLIAKPLVSTSINFLAGVCRIDSCQWLVKLEIIKPIGRVLITHEVMNNYYSIRKPADTERDLFQGRRSVVSNIYRTTACKARFIFVIFLSYPFRKVSLHSEDAT